MPTSRIVRREIESLRATVNARLDALAAAIDDSPTDPTDAICATLDQLAASLVALRTPTGGSELLGVAAEVFSAYFARVIVGAAEGDDFTVWHSRGFTPPLHFKTVLRSPHDSAIASAAADWRVAASADALGILGLPTRYAMALPLVARGRGNAMVYVENSPAADIDDRLAARIAEILAESIRARLHIKPAAATVNPEPAKQRRAKRLRMADGTMVVVDESRGTLVDLSTLGAQVLSRYAIEPNSAVRLVLPHDVGGLSCAGKVVWVIVEPHPSTQSAMYRAGVQFTDVKTGELAGYLEFFEPGITH